MLSGGFLRFYKLGDWSFANDETSTLGEVKTMFTDEQVSPEDPAYRLPRIIPLSYLILHAGNTLFGADEFGSRVILAMLGTAILGIIFIFLDGLMGRPVAIATSVLTALWTEHIYHSQQTRFYIIAAFFSFLCMLAGAVTLKQKNTGWGIFTCCLALAAILSHSVMVVLLPIVFMGILVGSYAERRPVPRKLWLFFPAAAILAAGFFLFYLSPLIHGWNPGATWGYSVTHSILASINMISWPISLLAAIGLILMIHERSAQNWYWVVCAFGWIAATMVFPLYVSYHPSYVFPLAFSGIVLAGFTIGEIYKFLRQRSVLIGAVWVGLACLLNLPSLVSHYADGSRPDMRTAANYVKSHWQAGDRVAGTAMGRFRYYAQGYAPTIPLAPGAAAIPKLKDLINSQGRLWIVLESQRGGIPEELDRWLQNNTIHQVRVQQRRFDYQENTMDVFLYTPSVDQRYAVKP